MYRRPPSLLVSVPVDARCSRQVRQNEVPGVVDGDLASRGPPERHPEVDLGHERPITVSRMSLAAP